MWLMIVLFVSCLLRSLNDHLGYSLWLGDEDDMAGFDFSAGSCPLIHFSFCIRAKRLVLDSNNAVAGFGFPGSLGNGFLLKGLS